MAGIIRATIWLRQIVDEKKKKKGIPEKNIYPPTEGRAFGPRLWIFLSGHPLFFCTIGKRPER